MVTALPLRVTLAVAGGLGMDLAAGCLSIFMSPFGRGLRWRGGCATGGGCQGAEEHG